MASNKKQKSFAEKIDERLKLNELIFNEFIDTFDDFIDDPTQSGVLTVDQADKILEGAYLYSKWIANHEQSKLINDLWIEWKIKYNELIED